MRLLELTLPTPAENLALDEALLAEADEHSTAASKATRETLRIWESPLPAVVLGRSSKTDDEVDVAECCRLRIPILRRPSGGATVLIGPGCLMYSLVLGLQNRPFLRAADEAHRFVLERLGAALRGAIGGDDTSETAARGIVCRGISDLAFGRKLTKFSGNAIRYGRNYLLYHGTILYDFDLGLLTALLKNPPLMPDYRRARPHDEFVGNLAMTESQIRQTIINAWTDADQEIDDVSAEWPQALAAQLLAGRYSRAEWNRRR